MRSTDTEPRDLLSTLDPELARWVHQAITSHGPRGVAPGERLSEPSATAILESLARHDPRRVALIERMLRNVVDGALAEARGEPHRPWWRPRGTSDPALTVAEVVLSSAPELGWALSCSGFGRVRERAVASLGAPPGAFALALLLRRLGDWVPQVVAVADAGLEDGLFGPGVDETHRASLVVGCAEILLGSLDGQRGQRALEPVRARLLACSGVAPALGNLVRTSPRDASARLLRLMLEGGWEIDEEDLARHAAHPGVRRMALTRCLGDGAIGEREHGLIAEALRDSAAEVRRAALNGALRAGPPPELESTLVSTLLDGSIGDQRRAAWGLRRLGVDPVRTALDALKREATPSLVVARVCAWGGADVRDALNEAYVRVPGKSLGWLTLLARVRDARAQARLIEIALGEGSEHEAREAATTLLEIGTHPPLDALERVADTGDAFGRRGLERFVATLPPITTLRFIHRLRAAGAVETAASLWARFERRVRRGAGGLTPATGELDALARELGEEDALIVRARALFG